MENKFEGFLIGLEYYIYYCQECNTDFAVKLGREVVCCPSCQGMNIIDGEMQQFC